MTNCKICGKEFKNAHKLKLFCSELCRKEAMRLRSKQANDKKREERTPIICKCGICGKEFETNTVNRKYCVGRCTRKAREAVLRKADAKRNIKIKTKKKKNIESIVTVNNQAKQQNLSYGKLVAREWMGER